MRIGNRFELVAVPAVIQHQKAESARLEHGALPRPSAPFLSGRRAEPKAREGKSLSEDREGVISGIVIGIEAKKRSCPSRFRV
jgi:hypothetical protein